MITSEAVRMTERGPVKWTKAIPPGRLAWPRRDGFTAIYTHTSREQAARMFDTGVLENDIDRADPSFSESYRWMSQQMKDRGAECRPGTSPVWAWTRIDRPTLRQWGKHDETSALVAALVPSNTVIESSHIDWHFVLNQSKFFPGDTERLEWDRWWDEVETKHPGVFRTAMTQWPEALRAEVTASWEQIFSPAVLSKEREIQACLPRIQLEHVTSVVFIDGEHASRMDLQK